MKHACSIISNEPCVENKFLSRVKTWAEQQKSGNSQDYTMTLIGDDGLSSSSASGYAYMLNLPNSSVIVFPERLIIKVSDFSI